METTDSLQFVPMEEWGDLEKAFLSDWPRGIPASSALVTQKKLVELGLDYGFKVYRPRGGDLTSGMVAFNKKADFNEIIIQCPRDDTTQLEEALLSTKRIKWSEPTIVPYLPEHMHSCIRRVAGKVGLDYDDHGNTYYIVFFGTDKSPFENISLPEDIKFQQLTEENVDFINSYWVNRYSSSQWLFKLLVKSKTGYGLFKNNELITWVFINEIGALSHLFTLEEHRKKGYAKVLIQLVCNARLKEKKNVLACCLGVNDSALKLYENLGFEKMHTVQWMYLTPKDEKN